LRPLAISRSLCKLYADPAPKDISAVQFTDSILSIAIVRELYKRKAWLYVNVANAPKATEDVFDVANVDLPWKVADVDT
jgi:hypothetical protein